MLEFVKRSDIFAQRVELNLAGKQGYQTLFGAFLSIIYVATIGFWTYTPFIDVGQEYICMLF